jgi:hypothetical protein
MRKRFEQQLNLGILAIGEVPIRTNSRHQLDPLLRALQYVFVTEQLNTNVFTLLDEHILKHKKRTGRLGMSLWEILVLSLVRLNLNIDYDFLVDLANNHISIRGIMGVDRSDFKEGKEYYRQTLMDNVVLLDEDILRKINDVIVEASHGLIKKKEGAEALELSIKMDSYVVETHIHFPTDINLLWDSGRKVLDMIGHLLNDGMDLTGWRKRRLHCRKLRNTYRKCAEIHRKKGANYQNRLINATGKYLSTSREILTKSRASIEQGVQLCSRGETTIKQFGLLQELQYYMKMLEKHIDLVDRRIVQGEKIPHCEKVFSIFEPHTEWISKGKMHKQVELGHNLAVATDQYHLVIDFEIMFKTSDAAVGLEMGQRIIKNYGAYHTVISMSFDRGYYSALAKKALSKNVDQLIMPKRGKKTLAQQEEENAEDYQKLRRAHSAVESNINQLEHNGLDRCADKGPKAFRRYIALGIVSYNLHRLGRMLIYDEKAENEKKKGNKAA